MQLHQDDHHLGLSHDLETMTRAILRRRQALLWLAGSAAVPLFACGGGGDSTTTSTTTTGSTTGTTTTTTGTTTTTTGSTTCAVTPEETAGPYPADGSNSNGSGTTSVLTLSGIVRSDITPSIPASLGTAAGVPLTVTLSLVNPNSSCADLAGYAIYLWHCDRDGQYSLYSSGAASQNYLRGVQETDANGEVTFTTIFPACYSGRMPHIHFEVYRSLSTATSYTNKLRTGQLAFPVDVCNTVYASTGYSASVRNLANISFTSDGVFADNAADGTLATETCTIAGSVASGYVATLTVGLSV